MNYGWVRSANRQESVNPLGDRGTLRRFRRAACKCPAAVPAISVVAARNAGTAVLLLSEDLDEVLELSDRIVVMRQGAIVYETAGALADAHTIGGHMVGHH